MSPLRWAITNQTYTCEKKNTVKKAESRKHCSKNWKSVINEMELTVWYYYYFYFFVSVTQFEMDLNLAYVKNFTCPTLFRSWTATLLWCLCRSIGRDFRALPFAQRKSRKSSRPKFTTCRNLFDHFSLLFIGQNKNKKIQYLIVRLSVWRA